MDDDESVAWDRNARPRELGRRAGAMGSGAGVAAPLMRGDPVRGRQGSVGCPWYASPGDIMAVNKARAPQHQPPLAAVVRHAPGGVAATPPIFTPDRKWSLRELRNSQPRSRADPRLHETEHACRRA